MHLTGSSHTQLLEYLRAVTYPVTKEELVNGLLARGADRQQLELVDRLPRRNYATADESLTDLEEISLVHPDEVSGLANYNDYLDLVIRKVGDVAHVNRQTYDRVVAAVMQLATSEHALSTDDAVQFERRLKAAFATLRGSMSEVSDDSAPTDPRDDLPRMTSLRS